MMRDEFTDFLQLISDNYQRFDLTDAQVDSWWRGLSGFSYFSVKASLQRHVESSNFVPRLFDILREARNIEGQRLKFEGVKSKLPGRPDVFDWLMDTLGEQYVMKEILAAIPGADTVLGLVGSKEWIPTWRALKHRLIEEAKELEREAQAKMFDRGSTETQVETTLTLLTTTPPPEAA